MWSGVNYSGIQTNAFTISSSGGTDEIDLGATNVPVGVSITFSPSFIPSGTSPGSFNIYMVVAVTNVAAGDYTPAIVLTNAVSSFATKSRAFNFHVENRVYWVASNPTVTNWTTAGNWAPTLPTGNSVSFEDPQVDIGGTNKVTVNTTIAHLNYMRSRYSTLWSTFLNSGVVLTVTNGFSANSISADNSGGTGHNFGLTISGASGATLLVTNLSRDFSLNQLNSAAASTTFKFTLSGLPVLKAYVRRFGLDDITMITEGTYGSQNAQCDFPASLNVVASYVGDITQEHFTNAISFWNHDDASYQNGSVFTATLGAANTFWADSFVAGGGRVNGLNVLTARAGGSTAQFRNSDGVSRMTLFGVAVDSGVNTISSGSRASFGWGSSSLDLLADQMWLGRCRPRQGAAANAHVWGVLAFGSGSVVDVNNAFLGYQAYTNDDDCHGIITNANGTFTVNKTLVLGYSLGDVGLSGGPYSVNGFGALTVSGASGRARINTLTVGGPGNLTTANSVTVYGSGAFSLTNTAGTATAKLNILAMTNASLTLHVNGTESPRIYVQSLKLGTGTTINFGAITNVGAYPSMVPLIDYDTINPGFNFSLGTFPAMTPAFSGYLTNDTTAGVIYLVLTNGPAEPGAVTWTGSLSSDWDTATTNWLNGVVPYTFADGVPVRFDDTGLSGSVNLTAARAPSRVTVSNSAVTYSFTGSGKVTGSSGLIKQGGGTLFMADGNNDFSGGTLISSGTVQVGVGDASGGIGSGNITNNAALIFNRSDNLTILNNISGSGSFTQSGAGKLTLSGTNSYAGDTTISAGTLALTGNSAIAGANIIVDVGSILDVSGRTDGTLNLASGQTLRGKGTLNGSLLAASGSTVSPGQSIGVLTVTNSVMLQGTTVMEIDKAGGTNDVLQSLVSITYGGTLVISNLNNPLSEGDSLKLFNAPVLSGSFGSIVPASPGIGLAWDTSDLTNNGRLKVISSSPPGLLKWTGAINANWDMTTTNWTALAVPTAYADGLPVQFDDTGLQTNVNLTTTLSPSLTIMNDSALTYTFGGAGKISGSGGLVKLGAGTFVIGNSGSNDFSGGISIGSGTVQVGNAGTGGNLGSGKVTNNAALVFNRTDGLSVPNDISGIGTLTQSGSGTTILSGNETFTGNTTVNAGVLALAGTSAIASSGNINVAGGAALAVAGRTDGTLTLVNGQTLRGDGTVQGNVTAAFGSTIQPGQSIGILSVTNALVLNGTVVMEIDNTAGTNDLLGGAASLNYGGTLVVSNYGTALADGDSFKLFDADNYTGAFTNIAPVRPGEGLVWDTSDLTDSGTLRVTLAPPEAPSASIKVDLSISGRAEAIDPNFLSWPIPGGNVISTNFSGITITFTRMGPYGTGLKGDWWKAGVDTFGCLMADDGLTVDNGDLGGQVEMRISGLSRGPHTIATYHNTWGDPTSTTFAPLNITVNGVLTFTNFVPSNRVTNNYDAASAFMQVNAEDGEDVVILYQSVTNVVATSKNVWISAVEIDTVDSTKRAIDPAPASGDEHVDADATKSVTLAWSGAQSAVSHDVYFGTSSNAVATATHASPEFKGNQVVTNYLVTNLSTLATYWWRVDEIDATNGVSKGDNWYFRTRHLAFPGAEGYGRFARGGRGGIVLEVTNLADSGPGTFREAVESSLAQEGPRTIVFAVSGLITLESELTVGKDNSKLTIAGQTAPGKGIQIRKWPFGFSGGDDVIVRDIRCFPGKYSGATVNGMGFGGVDNSIMDHCSSGWSMDECIPSRGAKNMTIQHVMIAEPLNVAGHKNYPPGTRHGYSSSTSGDIGSWHHDLLAHAEGRNWSLAGGLDGNGVFAGRLDIRDNVVYNWNGRTTDGGVAEMNFVNNYYKLGPVNGIKTYLNPDHGTNADGSYGQRYYSSGNVMPGFPQSNSGGWMVSTQFFASFVTTQNPTNAYKIVVSDVGCTQPMADDHDTRVIQETIDGSYHYSGSVSGLAGLPDDENDVGGWENYPEIHRDTNWDSDHDGLPDWWENMRGLNPNSAPGDFSDANADLQGDEYTELDRYLNYMAGIHYDCTNTATLDVGLVQFTKGFTNTSPTYSVFGVTNGTVTLVGGKTAHFTPTSGFSGLASFQFSVVDAVGDTMTNSVAIHVISAFAANTAPMLSAVSNRTVNVGVNVVITNTASDSDTPAQTLTFGLLSSPTNAAINSASGVLAWRPIVTQANTTNLFSVVVTDNGTPNLSATQSFSVIVNPLTLPGIASSTLLGEQFGLAVNGQVGPDYAVQASSNLVDWRTLLITNPAVMPFGWTDTNAPTLPMQFYRIKVGPPLP